MSIWTENERIHVGIMVAGKRIHRVNFHDLRHSCASLLINMGVPLEVIRDILGHTTVRTTERYAHLQIDRQEEALNRLSDAVSG